MAGAMVWAGGMLYKEVAQKLILYGIKGWVVTGAMLKVLEDFHHRASRKIVGMTDRRREDGEWEYPPVDDALEAIGLWPIKEYIKRR